VPHFPALLWNQGRAAELATLHGLYSRKAVRRFPPRFAHAPFRIGVGPLSRRMIAVAASADARPRPIHPLFAFLLAAGVPLFLGGLLGDITYGNTAEPQWANFAAWLIAGAMVFTGFALLWALLALILARPRRGWVLLCFVLLLATFALGLVDNFQHARDAWAIMPAAPILSGITTLLAALAAAVGLGTVRAGDAA
jgi:uncharacterized membrane protein